MFSSDKWFGGTTGFYPFKIGQSLRTNVGDAPRLTKTFGSGGNRQKWTFSFWLKRSDLNESLANYLFNAYSSGSEANFTFLHISNDHRISAGGYGRTYFQTNMLARDPTGWYNIVYALDTQQSEINRFKLYVNGTRITSFASGTQPSIDDLAINDAIQHTLFANFYNGSYDSHTGGYFADVNFIDNQQLDATSFGELKNGVWVPIDTAGLNFGTTGFRLEFKGTGTATSSGAVSSPTNIGDDTSGNNNHFAVSGVASTDICTDSPTNNFANFSVLNSDINASITEGGLRATMGGSGNYDQVRSDFGLSSGKWYWEVYLEARGYIPAIGVMAGYTGASINPTHWVTFGFGQWHVTYNSSVPTYQVNQNSGSGTNWSVTMPTTGEVIMVAIDVDNNKIWWGVDGTWYNSSGTANPATGTDPRVTLTSDQTWHPMVTLDTGGGGATNAKMRFNFGQESTFQGGKGAGTHSDENGNGLFQHPPPSGYLACCTSSLQDTTISPNQDTQADDYFNTVIYTGDGSSNKALTGFGFQPDWVWQKTRSASHDHFGMDSSRGANAYLKISLPSTEATATNFLKSFDSDGVTIGDDGVINGSGVRNVMWNWKANGGTTVSNTDGTITSTVQANTTAGFSIVLYTGTGTASTVGHGLDFAPTFIMVFSRDVANSTVVGLTAINGWTHYISLSNSGFSVSDSAIWNNIAPTTEVFNVGTADNTNKSTNTFVAYCFHDIEGYSKFNKFTGGGTSFPYVHLGFRPAYVMIKRTSSSGGWTVFDDTRNTANSTDLYLGWDGSFAEIDGSTLSPAINIDFTSNGFVVRSTENVLNSSGGTFLYFAFARQPFKFSNAR